MAHSLPLHSILLPRRFIHVDDKRKILLAGCGSYIDRFDLSTSPVLRSRLGVFDDGDVEGLVCVKDTPHFVAFSRRRLALVHKDNIKNGGILIHLQISESIEEIQQVLSAQFVKKKLEVLLLTASPLEVRKIVLFPSPFLHCSSSETIDATGEEETLVSATSDCPSSNELYIDIRGGSIVSTIRDRSSGDMDEVKFIRAAITEDSEDKALLSVDMKDDKIFILSSDRRRYEHSLAFNDNVPPKESIEAIPVPEEKRKGGRPILVAVSEDGDQYAVANSEKGIEMAQVGKLNIRYCTMPKKAGGAPPQLHDPGDYEQMVAANFDQNKSTEGFYERDRSTTSNKEFVSSSRITSLAISGRGKNAKPFFDDKIPHWIIAGSAAETDARSKEVIGYGVVDQRTWLASDGSVYAVWPKRNGGKPERIGVEGVYRRIVSENTASSGIMAAFSSNHLLVCTTKITKQYTFKAVSLVAVAVHKHYVCLQSQDGVLVVLDILQLTSTRYSASSLLKEGVAKRGRSPLLSKMASQGQGHHYFVVGFDNGKIRLLCGANSRAKVQQPNLDSLFTTGVAHDLLKISDEDEDSGFVRMGRFGSKDNVYALGSCGKLCRIEEKYGTGKVIKMSLSEAVDMERVLSITLLPDGDLLVCGFRKGVFVGVSLSTLRVLFSLAHRRSVFNSSISQCTVLVAKGKFVIYAYNRQSMLFTAEPYEGEKAVERALHSEKIVAHTSVYIGFGDNEKRASYESGHALITASVDGHVVVSSLWTNGRLVPLHRFRVPGVTCLAAFSYASKRCASCVLAESACKHRKAATKTFRWVLIVAGSSAGGLYFLSFYAASLSDPRVLDRPTHQSLPVPGTMESIHINARPSLHGLVRATVFVVDPESCGALEMTAMQKMQQFDDMQIVSEFESKNRYVRCGLAAVAFGERSAVSHSLLHPSSRLLRGYHVAVMHTPFVYTSDSFRPREGALIATEEGDLFLWGIVEEGSTPEKRRMAASLARRGDPIRLPAEDGIVEGKEAKWGVVANWASPSNDFGEVVALSSTLSPSSAATTIASLFSTGKAGIFLLALGKIVFVQWLETTVKDQVGISVCLQGTDNLNSRCSVPYPSSAVVSGGKSIEVVRICQVELKKALKKVWDDI